MTRILKHIIGLLALIVCSGVWTAASAQVFFTDNGYVEFVSTTPLLEFRGTSDNLTGQIDFETNEVDFFVDLNTLDTGNRRRDRDMRQVYLETEKYSFAEFYGRLTSEVDLSVESEQVVIVEGEFKMREISRPFRTEGILTVRPDGIHITAGWEILLEDYDIDRPRILFYELSDVQSVNIDLLLKPEE